MLKKYLRVIILAIFIVIALELATYIFLNNPQKQVYNYTLRSMRECKSLGTWETCYADFLGNTATAKGYKFALKVKDELTKKDPRNFSCHTAAHKIALENVKQNPNNPYDIFNYVSVSDCAYGFAHGTLEGLASKNGYQISVASATEMCRKISLVTQVGLDGGCIHAVGHIILSSYCDPNLPRSIAKAVKECSTSKDQPFYCYGGIFMESFIRDSLHTHCGVPYAQWQNNPQFTAQQDKICEAYAGDQANACWQQQSFIYVSLAQRNPEKFYKLCQRATTHEGVVSCYTHQVGLLARYEKLEGKYTFENLCAMFEKAEKSRCISKLVSSLLYTSSNYINIANRYCKSLTAQDQENCYQSAASVLSIKKPEHKKNICPKLPTEFQAECNGFKG